MPETVPGTGAPKISVCIPTYNRAALLPAFLQSIFAQTHPDFEVVIADNASTDATAEIIGGISDARLRYHRNETNIGPFRNMNLLLEMARGEYVTIVHDDDLYAPEFLERLSAMLDAHPDVGMVHCAAYEVDADGARRRLVQAYPTTRVVAGDTEFVRYLQNHNVCCSSVMARRRLYLDTGGFDLDLLCADYMMWVKMAARADIAYVAEPLLNMRVHLETVTSWLNPARWHSEFRTILERGLELGARLKPQLVRDRAGIERLAARTQGRRFLVAELAAVARGDYELARGYREVLQALRGLGLSSAYTLTAGLLTNRVGQRLLAAGNQVRRARARRHSELHGKAART
jgi:glycosyltransferase domain-containing protein